MSKHRADVQKADALPKEWHDGRLYAIVTEPGLYEYEGTVHSFVSAGTLLLYSMRPEDWTTV